MQDPGCGRRFMAELELCELDVRLRAGSTWAGRAMAISHSRLWLRSRRMCYPGAKLIIKIHHIDDQPLVLVGVVARCEYDADSMYDIEIGLEAVQNRAVLGKPRKPQQTRHASAGKA